MFPFWEIFDFNVLTHIRIVLKHLFICSGTNTDFSGSFRLQDALEDQRTVKTKVMTVTQTLVDGKVVSSSTETKERNL